jgi:hypothetical protein
MDVMFPYKLVAASLPNGKVEERRDRPSAVLVDLARNALLDGIVVNVLVMGLYFPLRMSTLHSTERSTHFNGRL